MPRKFLCWLFCVLPLLAACDLEELQQSLIPQAEVEFAKQYMELLQAGELEAALQQWDPAAAATFEMSRFEEVVGLIPEGEPVDITVVGSHTYQTLEKWQAQLTLQYEFPESWLLAGIVVERRDGEPVVIGMHLQPIDESLEATHAFEWSGRGVQGYLIIAAAFANVAFVLTTFVVCLRTPIPRRKWLWCIFVLVGTGTMSLNWTTGQVQTSMLSILMLGAGFEKVMYGPLMISIAAPLGAVVFWTRRPGWLQEAKAIAEGPDDKEETSE